LARVKIFHSIAYGLIKAEQNHGYGYMSRLGVKAGGSGLKEEIGEGNK
jgi:hypothetical protein